MTSTKNGLNEHLEGLLNRFRMVAPLDPQAVADERAKFLAQGETFRTAVSQRSNRRHNGWINNLSHSFQRKERIPMLNALIAMIVTLTIVFGGAGATVYAAQGSMPDQPLYPVKTWSEDSRISLAGSAQGKLDMTLEFTDRRVAEVIKLQATGKSIPAGVTNRLQQELNAALQIAAGMDDPKMVQALAQIRQQAEIQSQIVASVVNAGPNQGDPTLARIQERLQEQVRLAAAGEADPQGFRIQVGDRDRLNRPSQTPQPTQPRPATHTPAPTPVPSGGSYGPGPGEPNPSQTPQPTGGSYGPGPDAGQSTKTPGGYGPGPQAGTATCTPAHDGDGPGPGPLNPSATPQAGEPGDGNGPATVTPQHGDNGQGGQPTEEPGQGGGKP